MTLSSCRWDEDAFVVVATGTLPEEPQFRQKRGVLLGFFWGRLRGLLMLQTQPLDLLKDLPEWVSLLISSLNSCGGGNTEMIYFT